MTRFQNYRKETSERSDSSNWAKQTLMANTGYFFDSIEGCSENSLNMVTHIMERARIDIAESQTPYTNSHILNDIVALEGSGTLNRKIAIAARLGLPLHYVLYCNETQQVFLYRITSPSHIELDSTFGSFAQFSQWIASIKGWKSNKTYREIDDLPYFDKELRKAGTAWPTNIDCIISDRTGPIAILEFQNAGATTVERHCNNEFFLCKQMTQQPNGHVRFHDDIRRWLSQEILRVQSGMRLIIITWSQHSRSFTIKEVSHIVFPKLTFSNWDLDTRYKMAMHQYATTKSRQSADAILRSFSTFYISHQNGRTSTTDNTPPLQTSAFPMLHYKWKQTTQSETGAEIAPQLQSILN